MDIYVESRTKNVDYYWLSQSTALEKVHTVPSIIQSVTKFNGDKDLKLIHESEPSIVLLRSQGQLLLLVSGLRTKRQDKDRRYIRDSIGWIGEKTDEPKLRAIAALVLENNFQILENLVVESSNSSGELFEVNWQTIEQLTPPNIIATSNSPQENSKIALFSEQSKQQLVDELRKYALPARDGALVAVTTGFKPKAIFARANVWRGLSNDTSLSPEWESTLTSPRAIPSSQPNPKRLVMIAGTMIAGTLIIILAVSVFLNRKPATIELVKYCEKRNININTTKIQLENNSSKGYHVEALKSILIGLDELNEANNSSKMFDDATKKAVKKFQEDYNKKNPTHKKIEANGKVATDTWNALLNKTLEDTYTWKALLNKILEDDDNNIIEHWEKVCEFANVK